MNIKIERSQANSFGGKQMRQIITQIKRTKEKYVG
jgi:hypothetical protein